MLRTILSFITPIFNIGRSVTQPVVTKTPRNPTTVYGNKEMMSDTINNNPLINIDFSRSSSTIAKNDVYTDRMMLLHTISLN